MLNSLRELHHSSLGLPEGSYIYSLGPYGDDALAVISSDNSLRCFDRRTLQLLPDGVIGSIHVGQGDESGPTSLCQVAAGNGPTSLLATSGRDGTVKIWDARARKQLAVSTFSTENGAPLTALAFDAGSHSLVAGTELLSHQASVVFWDIRKDNQPRLQYVDSHNDDLTELQFHPTRNNMLLSGSTDGLVNIYDTSITDEDDALLQVIKHSSIHHAGFLSEEVVYTLSHDELFSIHPLTNPDDGAEAAVPVHFGDLRPTLECEYVAQVLSNTSGTYIAAGSTSRKSINLTPIVPTGQFNFHLDQSKTWELLGAHGEEIVRSVYIDDQSQTVFTCGEDGFVRVWGEEDSQEEGGMEIDAEEGGHDKQRKHKSPALPRHRKEKKHKEKKRSKPY